MLSPQKDEVMHMTTTGCNVALWPLGRVRNFDCVFNATVLLV